MVTSSSAVTRVVTALVVVTAVAAGGAAAADGLFTVADSTDTVSPASMNESVTASETTTFSVTVNDSANGNDTDTGRLTVETQQSDVPSDFPGTPEQFTAIAGDDGEIDTFDLVDAIQGASDDGEYNGVEISTFDFADIISWNSN